MLQAALRYLERGWSVFPVKDKKPLIRWKEAGCQERLPSPEQVTQWWTDFHDAGIALALGKVSGVVRIDAEGPVPWDKYGQLPETAEFITPSGGKGWLYSYMDGANTAVLWKGAEDHQELRVQSDGAYTVLPPTPGYSWVRECKPVRMPTWLRDFYVERVLQELTRELRPTLRQPDRSEIAEALQHVDADDYDRWIHVGMALHSAGDEYLELWDKWSKGSEKYQEGECQRRWASFRSSPGGLTTRSILYFAEQQGWRPPNRHEPLTDLGNARILARMGEGKILHCDKWGWMAWDGARWQLDGAVKTVQEMQKSALEYRLNRAVESLARHLRNDPNAEGHNEIRKRKMKTILSIRKHEDESRIRGARALAESEPCISASYKRFDQKRWLFNCSNGTLDLERCTIKEHDPTDWLTQVSPTAFDEGAKCTRWLQFLEEILPDAEVRKFLKQFLGCCLSGDVSPQMMPVFWGGGSNGKSTLIGAVMHVLGEDYSMKAKRDLLMAKRTSEHPTSVARLRGKRFVACVETAEDGRLDETLVKELTGGDVIAARRMREDEWEFFPTHKPVLVTNHRPEVRGTDDAIWRRLPLVPFEVRYAEDDPRRDPMLPERLKEEASGILLWMLEGCQEWLGNSRKLERPTAVKDATQSYRSEQDRIGAFIEDKCVVGPERKVRVEKLMEAYMAWCVINKHQQMNGNAFGRALTEKGFHLEAKGSKYRVGIDLQ